MRSLFMVGALCSVVMMFTGCCSSNCRLLGNRQLVGETCSGGCGAESHAVSDCGCSASHSVGGCNGGSCGLSQTRQASLQNRLARAETRSNDGGLLGRLAASNHEFIAAESGAAGGVLGGRVAGRIAQVGGQGLGGRVAGRVAQVGGQGLGGRVAGRVAQAGGVIGCGRGGCGLRGAGLCSSCNARARLAGAAGRLHPASIWGNHTKPIGGTIPHTATPPTFNGGPGGGGVPQYVYPYYTTRGPRDFLNTNPPSIGP